MAGVSVLCTALLWLRTDHLTPASPYFGLPWDHHMYIFMASHGRKGLSAVVLGSETTKVLTHSKTPVLVCR